MKDSKLIGLLRTFSPSEWSAFGDFISSPFFNKREKLIEFYQYLQPFYPAFTPEKLEKEHVYQALYPGAAYEDKRMRYEMSFLTKLAEEFLQVQAFRQKPYLGGILLAESFLERKLEKNYQQEHQRLSAEMAEQKLRNPEYYFHQLELADLADRHFLAQRERRFDPSIQSAANALDLFYLSKKLRYWCGMLDRQKFLTARYDLLFQNETQSMLQTGSFPEKPDIDLFYLLFQVIDAEENDEAFLRLSADLQRQQEHLDFSDLQSVYQFMINYCARKIRAGREEYVERALHLYLEGIQRGLFFENGYLSPWTFKNVVSLGLRLQRFDWAEAFIQDNHSSISPSFRQDVLNFNLADLYFHKNDFDRTLEYLNRLKYSDIYFNLNGRVLLLKTYFHLDEISSLLSLIASFTIYLKRNKKIVGNTKKSYLNFCSLLYRIVRDKPGDAEPTRRAIREAALLIDRNWLLKVLDR